MLQQIRSSIQSENLRKLPWFGVYKLKKAKWSSVLGCLLLPTNLTLPSKYKDLLQIQIKGEMGGCLVVVFTEQNQVLRAFIQAKVCCFSYNPFFFQIGKGPQGLWSKKSLPISCQLSNTPGFGSHNSSLFDRV